MRVEGGNFSRLIDHAGDTRPLSQQEQRKQHEAQGVCVCVCGWVGGCVGKDHRTLKALFYFAIAQLCYRLVGA